MIDRFAIVNSQHLSKDKIQGGQSIPSNSHIQSCAALRKSSANVIDGFVPSFPFPQTRHFLTLKIEMHLRLETASLFDLHNTAEVSITL